MFALTFVKELSHLTAWLDVLGCSDYAEALVKVDSRENHTLTFNTHHLSGGKVGYEENALADEYGWVFIECCNTAEDGTVGA